MDELVKFLSIGAMPKQAFLTEERCFSSEEEASPLPEHLEIDDFLQQQGETFPHMLLRMIDERNLKDSQVYRDANIDRQLFFKIRGDEDDIPSKKTVICFCIAGREGVILLS